MLFNSLKVFLTGLAMGTADIVPGISGGTMALILGSYEKLILSLRTLRHKSSCQFLFPLLLGMGTALLALSGVVHQILKNPDSRSWFYSLFLGLVLASVVILTKLLKVSGSPIKRTYFLLLALGAAMAWFLTGSSVEMLGSKAPLYKVQVSLPYTYLESEARLINYKKGFLTQLTENEVKDLIQKKVIPSDASIYLVDNDQEVKLEISPAPFFDFKAMIGGMIAVIAMLLPGISGSYLLTMMGLYGPAIAALADLFAAIKIGSLDREALRFLFSMGVGIGVGATLFSHFISWLLQHKRVPTLMLLIGFMLGALRTVWPFWTTAFRINPLRFDKGLELVALNPTLPQPLSLEFLFSLAAFIAGFSFVLWLESQAEQRKTVRGS